MNDDEQFMAQFEQRLKLEPKPQWAFKKKSMPWIEIGWALAAALMLAVYWTELRFGFSIVWIETVARLAHIPSRILYTSLAAAIGLSILAAPKVAKEL